MFTGVKNCRKQLKKLEKAQAYLVESANMFDYCCDTKGNRVSGRKDEVDGSKSAAEDEAISAILEARELLEEILKDYGAN